MNEIDVAAAGIEVPAWANAAGEFAAAALEELGIKGWELSILLCDDRFSTNLNERYRGESGPTDVLSFSQASAGGAGEGTAGKRIVAGDVVICVDALRRNAVRYEQPVETELKRLLVHGILHLHGLDHPPEGESEMLAEQERVLERLREKTIGI